MISLCHQHKARPACTSVVWPGSILLADQLQVLILISLKWKLDSAKNVRWIIPSKKFVKLRVNIFFSSNSLIMSQRLGVTYFSEMCPSTFCNPSTGSTIVPVLNYWFKVKKYFLLYNRWAVVINFHHFPPRVTCRPHPSMKSCYLMLLLLAYLKIQRYTVGAVDGKVYLAKRRNLLGELPANLITSRAKPVKLFPFCGTNPIILFILSRDFSHQFSIGTFKIYIN